MDNDLHVEYIKDLHDETYEEWLEECVEWLRLYDESPSPAIFLPQSASTT